MIPGDDPEGVNRAAIVSTMYPLIDRRGFLAGSARAMPLATFLSIKVKIAEERTDCGHDQLENMGPILFSGASIQRVDNTMKSRNPKIRGEKGSISLYFLPESWLRTIAFRVPVIPNDGENFNIISLIHGTTPRLCEAMALLESD